MGIKITTELFKNKLVLINSKVEVLGEYINTKNNKSAKQLQTEWKEREKLILTLGYKLVYIWEQDYMEQTNGT